MNLEDIKIEKDLKIVFMGTPDFAVPILQALIDNYGVRAVVTQPDKVVGRDAKIIFSPIKELAISNNILVLQPKKVREEYQEIIDLEPDIIVTCAYGQIIPKKLLDAPRLGCINVHASLLPKLRGGAPIHRAIINGYAKTGVTIMYMNEGMDEGDIISTKEVLIGDNDTTEALHDKLSLIGRDLLLETLPSIINGTNNRIKQEESLVTYAPIIKREDEKINFSKTKREVHNLIRGLNSFPGAYTTFNGKILKIWESRISDKFPNGMDGEITTLYQDGFGVKVSNGEVVITKVQPEGKKKMSARDFINGELNKENIIGKVLE